MSAWTDHVARWENCTRCDLCRQRDRICLARGEVPCDVLFVGEAPGSSEDAWGLPFYGKAGDLMQQIIDRAVPAGMPYALTNLVACFPREAKGRGDNEPERNEILACRPRLVEFVRLAAPKLIVLVGQLAAKYIHGAAMFRLDGEAEQPEWIPAGKSLEFVEIVHPAGILRREVPLAQKQSAVQHSIVKIRCAIRAVYNGGGTITKRELPDASLQEPYSDADVPF